MVRIHKEKHPRRTIVAIALFMGASQLAVAQAPKALNIDVESCVALEKPEERLACFEAQVEAARQRAAPASPSDATGTDAPASVGAGTAVGAGASTVAVAGASAAIGAAAVTGPSAAAGNGPTGAAERAPASTGAAAPVEPSTAPAVQSQKSASEARAIEDFGLPEPTPQQKAKKREPIEIVATVTELRQTVPNAYVITLDNGQVWRQVHPMPYPLRTGLEVRVHETQLGYRLTAPELHGQINVERVR